MSVKIDKIDVIILQDPAADYVKFEGSYQNVLVVVHGSNGEIGVGESDSPPHIIESIIKTPSYNSLSQGLEEVLLGEELDNPQRLWKKMYDSTLWHGRVGVVIHAISALDIALWDLFGKINKKPIFEYFGGLKHEAIPAYATIYPMDRDEWKLQVDEVLAKNFKKIKICVENWWSEEEFTKQTLRDLRKYVGDEIDLMLDVALVITDLHELEKFVPILEELDFKWLEAPLPLTQIKEHAYLVEKYNIPIGVGDLGLTTVDEYIPFIEKNAIDIAQPDLSMFGGFTQFLKLKKMFENTNKRIITHAYNTNIIISANLHALSSQNKLEPLEYSTSPSILRNELTNEKFILNKDGCVIIDTEKFGLGVSINWDIVKRCQKE